MRKKDNEERSSLISRAILIWFFLSLLEYIVLMVLLRSRQYLSPIPIIADDDAREIIFIGSIVVYCVTLIALIAWYIRKWKMLKSGKTNGSD